MQERNVIPREVGATRDLRVGTSAESLELQRRLGSHAIPQEAIEKTASSVQKKIEALCEKNGSKTARAVREMLEPFMAKKSDLKIPDVNEKFDELLESAPPASSDAHMKRLHHHDVPSL